MGAAICAIGVIISLGIGIINGFRFGHWAALFVAVPFGVIFLIFAIAVRRPESSKFYKT
jgi:hypothetical protein